MPCCGAANSVVSRGVGMRKNGGTRSRGNEMKRLASALLIAGIAMTGCASPETRGPAAANRTGGLDADLVHECIAERQRRSAWAGVPDRSARSGQGIGNAPAVKAGCAYNVNR